MSFTIEIPDALVDQLRAEAAARGEDLNQYAVAKLEMPVSAEDDEADEELIAALREGIADADAGRTVSLEEMRDSALAALVAHRHKIGGVGPANSQ
ncbi:MAG: hypothetical protein V4671_23550 [Armatimonadota bacterium]